MENISQSKILRDSLKLNIYDFNLKKFSIEKEWAKNFDEYIEINTLTYFNEYLEQDIAVGLYNKSLNLDLAIQKAPDINLDFMNHKTNYMQKFQHKCLSLDMKTSVNLAEPANKILNNTPKYYKQALQTYLQNFSNKDINFNDLLDWIKNLENSCENTQEHLIIWRQGLYILHYRDSLPPIRISKSFNTNLLNSESLGVYENSINHYNDVISKYNFHSCKDIITSV